MSADTVQIYIYVMAQNRFDCQIRQCTVENVDNFSNFETWYWKKEV